MSELGPRQDNVLRPGTNVDIRRTDGRIHPAVVSAVRPHLVTVEWFENGQTKGKEVDRQTLVALNPGLASPRRNDSTGSLGAPTPHRKTTAGSLPCTPAREEEDPERAAQLGLALSRKKTEAGARQQLRNQLVEQEEAEAVADLLRRYRAVVDVSDLWMTTDVRLLTRMLSTRALEDDTWLRELEELLTVKMELLSNLRDAVNNLRSVKDSTRTFIRDAEGNGKH
ncbi:uncharacterized protein LOC144096660 [Amblyomma americanum]|uniref:Kinesin-like protein KIF2A-like N-terminal domain-containing protein n=1 Tax=Amblyomma americanum TaxID=6943 RepID=A0AAQ4DRF4_AMBAM